MHATYYLMVKKGSAKDAPRQCMMVNREDLEQTKNRFDGQITLCNVYSVQKSQVKVCHFHFLGFSQIQCFLPGI
jgi:hypothetical protein